MASDSELMGRAGTGDIRAFEVLVERHRDRLEAFLYRLSWDRERAEECAQETFVRLWLARQRYDQDKKFITYLYTIAHNCWIDRTRRENAQPQTVPLEDQIGSGAQDLLERLVREAESEERMVLLRCEMLRIRQAIGKLPLKQRVAFVLAALEELPYGEIAAILDIPEGTVKSRVHYALVRLRKSLLQ